MKIIRRIALFCLLTGLFFSCVPQKKYAELETMQAKTMTENNQLKSKNIDLAKENSDFDAELKKLKKEVEGLRRDTSIQGTTLSQLKTNYDNINSTYKLLLERNKELLAGNTSANTKLMGQLQESQKDLQSQQDALQALKIELQKKEESLKKREAKVKELDSLLNKKNSTMKAIKDKIQDALLGFKDQGLTVERRNGKVYVSLEEKLLFPSASYKVSSKGIKVLKELGKVLENNKNIKIMVVGHTDNVPYKGSGVIKNNWDLSVLRSTSVVKIITENSNINPKRIIAAGRSEFDPIESNETAAGKKKNRRIEIVLTPKLDELLQIINN